jgi:hypothetical protein
MADLKVRAIRKYHDNNGILLGYTIQDIVTGQQMNVDKNSLKNAVINGQCEVVNMTLTSDGRLIGKAAPAPKKKAAQQRYGSGVQLVEVYTNGKNISAAMVHYNRETADRGELIGVQAGYSLDVGHEVLSKIKSGWYDNIKEVDGKIDFAGCGVKKKSFKTMKAKLIKILADNWGTPDFRVEKENSGKYNYDIITANSDSTLWDSDMLTQTVLALVTDAMYTNKIKVVNYDSSTTTVACMTGIKDVRKALKEIK